MTTVAVTLASCGVSWLLYSKAISAHSNHCCKVGGDVRWGIFWSAAFLYFHHRGAWWNSAIHPSVAWCSCPGYRHAGCLQLSLCRLPEVCGLWTHLRTDVDPPRFLDRTAISGNILFWRPRSNTLSSHIIAAPLVHTFLPPVYSFLNSSRRWRARACVQE